ncbi:hypothetical protein [Polaribacter butkevichii]|uniref:hypothetical protein n=1 Tax=Polaribacter butkevichii TaxID=218490 RepID=UPI0011B00303|nr:hypothetical protein [Polaribacter butkevichii]
MLDYWKYKEISKIDLKELYLSYWKRYEYSENEIQKIDKISDDEFVLTTKYIYSKYFNHINNYRLSETKFKFNKLGKIASITNLSLKKIDHQYILDNNLIRDFSYTKKVLKKNNTDLTIVLTIFLLFNLLIQAFISNGTISKSVKVTNTKDNNSNKQTDKKVSNENLRDKSINELKLKEQVALGELNNRIEKEKKVLKDKAWQEALIKVEKKRIESEKKIEAQNEAERIRKNKITKEKRQNDLRLEKERFEKEKRLAAKKEARRTKKEAEEAKIKREKAVIQKRQDREREKRKKEEKEEKLNNSNISIVEEEEDSFFDDNLSQYITEIPDDEEQEDESDIGDFLTDKYMPQNLKNKLKKK